jgi:16S rRNA (guanine966-N2)-methyltransferase
MRGGGRSGAKIATSSLRIIGGQWRGRKLLFPCIDGLRPTSDRIRETLFNWLAPDIHQAQCLDLCAGSGALGFEAVSRGAAAAVLLETQSAAAAALKAHCQVLGTQAVRVLQQDALRYLQQGPCETFNLVFLDPPFAANLWQDLVLALVARPWLAENALVYIEAPLNQPLQLPASLQLIKDKQAGRVAYRLYRYNFDLCDSTDTQSPAPSGDSA